MKLEMVYKKTFLSKYYNQIKNIMFMNELLDEVTLNKKAFILMNKIVIKSVLFSLLYFIFAKGPFALLTIFIAVITFKSSIIKYFRKNDLTNELKAGIELYKNRFLKHKIVKRALEDVIEERTGVMKRHFEEIYNLVDLPTVEAQIELDKYIEKTPNDYLKLLAINTHLTHFGGDREENGESIFVNNIQGILNQMSFLKREKEKFFREIKTDKLRILSPIFLLPLIRMAIMKFADTLKDSGDIINNFYNGIWGQVVVIFIFIVMIFSYSIYSKFTQDKFLVKENKKKVYSWILPIIKIIMPKKGSVKYLKLRRKILLSGRNYTIESYYGKKIITAILAIILVFTFIQINQVSGERNILKTSEETKIINVFKSDKFSEEKIEEKINDLNIENYKIFLMAFFIGILGYFYPNLQINLDKIINEESYISEDITRLYSISIILSKDENMTVERLLLWLEKFSKVFRPIFSEINEAYQDNTRGGVKILKEMYRTTPYDEFKLLIDNIISAETGLNMQESFTGIRYALKSKLADMREEIDYSVNFQITLSENLAALVQDLTIGFYGFLPIILSVFKMIIEIYNQMEI